MLVNTDPRDDTGRFTWSRVPFDRHHISKVSAIAALAPPADPVSARIMRAVRIWQDLPPVMQERLDYIFDEHWMDLQHCYGILFIDLLTTHDDFLVRTIGAPQVSYSGRALGRFDAQTAQALQEILLALMSGGGKVTPFAGLEQPLQSHIAEYLLPSEWPEQMHGPVMSKRVWMLTPR